MTVSDFDRLVEQQLDACKKTLVYKGDEYSANDVDRLGNIKRGARMTGTTPMKCLRGYLVKHLTSIMDMVDNDDLGFIYSFGQWDEKITDTINYLILLKALVAEKGVVTECKTSK